MPEEFDPYYKWLAIPPKHQPPDHYRLLGIDKFESDPEVIDAAANQRMAYLQDAATGPYVKESQKLLNEIAAARRCLLNPEQKAAYDRKLEAAQAKSDASATPVEAGQAQQPMKWILAGGASLIVLLMLIVGILLVRSGGLSGANQPAASGGDATIKFQWPLEEREGAAFIFDGEKQELPDEPVIELEVDAGRHQIVLKRDGFIDIRHSIVVNKGENKKFGLNWRRQRDGQ